MGGMTSTKNCMKATIMIASVPVIVIGAIALGMGLWIAFDNPSFIGLTHLEEFSVVDQSFVRNGAYIVIAGGACVLAFGIYGVIAAATESPVLLGVYVTLLSLVMAIEVAATVLGVVFKHMWEQNMEESVIEKIAERYDGILNSEDFFTYHYNNFQQEMECCGFYDYKDFVTNATKWNRTVDSSVAMVIPPACCRPSPSSNDTSTLQNCVYSPTADNAFLTGCKGAIEDLFYRYECVIIGVASAIVFCQLLMMVLTLVMLCTKVDNSYTFKDGKQI
ncbi:LOW QUALITY PROTEIN: tetraspanin-1-like [Pecten maximus]|uniref:LOW QUALITY PROTEIN: tetraspanin-1-like n=1 Tax=Pecten maximus TaxID=6579 RepID=UPI001458EC19|nr:LOW QUALITY PROTEIN: tetraspanin-1-like [Pecten maximus]